MHSQSLASRDSGTNPLKIPRDDCAAIFYLFPIKILSPVSRGKETAGKPLGVRVTSFEST